MHTRKNASPELVFVVHPYLHFYQHHGAYLLRSKELLFASDFDFYVRLVVLVLRLEGEELDVLLHRRVVPVSPDQALDVENGILRVGGELVLGRVSNESLALQGERYVGRRNPVALVVGDNFHSSVFVHADAEERKL